MNFENKLEMDDDDSAEDLIQENQFNGTIFLIDCRKSLFNKTLQIDKEMAEISWFEAIMEGCVSAAKNKAHYNDKDRLSLVFFRVNKTTDVIMKNVFVVQSLEMISIQNIHKLIQLKSLTETQFEEQFGFSEEVSVFNALWCCQHLFGKCKQKFGSKQILLFTDDDDPHFGDDNLKRRILVKSRDLMQTDTHIELIPISSSEGFNVDKFYKTMLLTNLRDDNEEALIINDPVSVIKELTTRMNHKQHRKRTLAHLKWQLGSEKLVISVGVYNLIGKTLPPSSVKLDRSTNVEVITKSALFLKETDQMLMSFDTKQCLTVEGKTICFEKDELDKIRSIIEPGIRLLGFKPLSYLKPHYHIAPSQFIYPDDSIIEGSSLFFSSLLIRCSQRNLFALCVYVPRKSSKIRFVALVPQVEKLDSSGLQTRPPGFHVVFLPFCNDMKQLPLPTTSPEVSDGDKEIFKKLIETLLIEYDPETILNPSLQRKLAIIEAMALDYEKVGDVEDHTVINCDDINGHCGPFLEKFRDHFELGIQSAKKVKLDIEAVDIESFYKIEQLHKLTVPVLKNEAKKLGIKLSGTKKNEIIEDINKYFVKK